MGVRKFRSVEDMPGPIPRRPLDPENLALMCEWTAVAYRLRPWHFPPGVHKYRSAQEAEAARKRWVAAEGP